MTGVGKFGFMRALNNASVSASPIVADPLRLISPTEIGNGGVTVPPTVSAVTNASPMFTDKLALISPRCTTFRPTVLEKIREALSTTLGLRLTCAGGRASSLPNVSVRLSTVSVRLLMPAATGVNDNRATLKVPDGELPTWK